MGHKLILDVPADLYESLRKEAHRFGRTPEEVGAEWLSDGAKRAADDPLLALAGAFESGVTDVGLHHDEYLGDALLSELRPSERSDGVV